MTRGADFKTRVRERMARTGERYTTARAHLLAQKHPSNSERGLFPSVHHVGGLQPDVAPTRNLLADSGVVLPNGGAPDEAMVFGLAGGIGFLYGVFEYEDTPTMTIVARNRSMPDPFLQDVFGRCGVEPEIATTSGAATASRSLEAHLGEQRSVLCSVGAGPLGYNGVPQGESAAAPLVIRVIGVDGDDVLIDDRSPAPLRVAAADLAAARAATRSAKHRAITVTSVNPDHDWNQAIVSAIDAGVDGYDTPPVPQWASNVGTKGLLKWQQLLTNSKDKKGWPRVFAEGRRAAIALTRLHDCIQHDSTAPDAGRRLHADFLDQAGATINRDLGAASASLREAANHWHRISEFALGADSALMRYAALADSRAELLDAGGDGARSLELRKEQDDIVNSCKLDSGTALDAYEQIANEVGAIVELERTALSVLGP